MRIEDTLKRFAGQPLTHSLLMAMLKDYRRPHNKIRELKNQNILQPVRRELYITGSELHVPPPSFYLLANHIYGPSYVSMEGALSYWGLIPEKVNTLSSMTTGSSKKFRTPVGLFTYIHIKLPYYSFGIQHVEPADNQGVLMACPEKALCDLIAKRPGIILRSIKQTAAFLEEDLRLDRGTLLQLNGKLIARWAHAAPKPAGMLLLVKTLETL